MLDGDWSSDVCSSDLWSTEQGIELTSTGVQVFGGVGFIEETGACQYYRDARITTIYEGTTGIQANDLVGRKLAREKTPGAAMRALLGDIAATATEMAGDDALAPMADQLEAAAAAMERAADWILFNYESGTAAALAGAVPFLKLTGIVAGGWLLAKSAVVARHQIAAGNADPFYAGKIATAAYFAAHQLPFAQAYAAEVTGGSDSTLGLAENLF
jgi:hypothetical protein